MAITGQGQLTHLVTQNKYIYLWHWWLAHVSNTRIVKTTKLVISIVLKQKSREYDFAEIFIDSDNSNAILDEEESPIQLSAETSTTAIHQTIENPDVIDKICIPCIGSKSTQIVRQNKSMTQTTTKLEEVHSNL